MITIYKFIDYRQYLNEVYTEIKANDKTFSFRSFARMAGSSSPNFLQLITSRSLNISEKSIVAYVNSMKLNRKEEDYFRTIILFDHAKTHEEKDSYFQRILQIRGYNNATIIQKEQYNYFSHWYIPVIRELVTCKDFSSDPQWIATRIIPEISVSQVRKGIQLLESLGLIYRDNEVGQWKQTNRSISTPSEVLSVALTKYHKQLLTLAQESIDRFDSSKRDIRSVTIGLSEANVMEIRKRIEGFWSELLAFAEKQSDIENVIQVNIQMFPLTNNGGDNDSK